MNDAVTFGRSSHVLWRRVGDEVLVADAEGTGVNSLSPPASATWVLLEHPRPLQDLLEELASRFGGSATEIAGHVQRLLDQLEERGLVIRVVDDG